MAREADYYTVNEAARVRQTLRSDELEIEQGKERIEGVHRALEDARTRPTSLLQPSKAGDDEPP